jgi:hypothetical protein
MSPFMSRFLVAGIVVLATGCSGGSAAHGPPVASVPASRTPSTQTTLPKSIPTQTTQIALPAPPVAAPPPRVVVRSPNGMVAAATADGAFVWAFDPHTLAIGDPELVTSGANLLAYGGGSVAVIDRTGTVIGHGTSAPNGWLYPAPSGLSWAWTTSDSTAQPPAPRVSSLWVAGIGQRPTRVKTWTGAYSVTARQWSDAGIVVVKLSETCGGYPQSSSLVDPVHGTETALFGAGRWPLEVRAGLSLATDVDRQMLFVIGRVQITRTYPLPVQGAGVDPSGSRVFVSMIDQGGCGGRPMAATSVIDVASDSQATIEGFFADAWLDDQHLLGRSLLLHPEVQGPFLGSTIQIADLSGHVSNLAVGSLIGVLGSQSS